MFSSRTLRPGRVPIGTDFAGVVDAVGEGARSFTVGDRVYGVFVVMLGHPGAHAQFVNVSVSRVRPMPEGLGFMEAAALPGAALTALNGLRLAAGEFKPFIEHVYPLAEAAEAFALAKAGGVVGKVMLEVQSH